MKILNFYFESVNPETSTTSLLGVKGISIPLRSTRSLSLSRFSEKLKEYFCESDPEDKRYVKNFWCYVEIGPEDTKGLSTPVRFSSTVSLKDNFNADFILSYLRRLSNLSLEEALLMKARHEGVLDAGLRLADPKGKILDKIEVRLD